MLANGDSGMLGAEIIKVKNPVCCICHNGPEKFYPEGSQYSERIMRSPRRKGGGKALNGSSEIDDKSQEFVKRHYSKGYKTS